MLFLVLGSLAALGRVLGMLRVIIQRHLAAGQTVGHLLVPLVQCNVQWRTSWFLLCCLLRLQLEENERERVCEKISRAGSAIIITRCMVFSKSCGGSGLFMVLHPRSRSLVC